MCPFRVLAVLRAEVRLPREERGEVVLGRELEGVVFGIVVVGVGVIIAG